MQSEMFKPQRNPHIVPKVKVHFKENNEESEEFLHENRSRLSDQCQKLLGILQAGIRITNKDAIINYGIGDVRRRVLDLKLSGIVVNSAWVVDDHGKRLHKEYFI